MLLCASYPIPFCHPSATFACGAGFRSFPSTRAVYFHSNVRNNGCVLSSLEYLLVFLWSGFDLVLSRLLVVSFRVTSSWAVRTFVVRPSLLYHLCVSSDKFFGIWFWICDLRFVKRFLCRLYLYVVFLHFSVWIK